MPARRLAAPAALTAFFAVMLAFLVTFADRDGYEGDDLNSILPMAHLAAAKQGLLLLYRYAWQPLSYEAGAALWRLFGTPEAVFLAAPVAGAVALALILALTWREAERRTGTALVALLGVPELWYSSLYFNSTVLGLPFEAAALLLLRRRTDAASAALAGLLMAVAILMRLDFALVGPLLAMLAWRPGEGLARPAWLLAGVAVGLGVGWVAGLVDLAEIARIQAASTAEIRARADLPGWDWRTKAFVVSIVLSPVGWLLLLGGGPLVVAAGLRENWRRQLLWLAAVLPAAWPLTALLSPKYLLPLHAMLPLLFVHCQDRLKALASGRWMPVGLGLLAALPIVFSLSLRRHPPFLQPGLIPVRPVGTHDGERGYGGYLWQMIATDGPAAQMPDQRAAARLAGALARPGRDVVIVGGEDFFDRGAIAWRHLQLRLERAGVHGRLVAPHALLFKLENRRLILVRSIPAQPATGVRIIDLRPHERRP